MPTDAVANLREIARRAAGSEPLDELGPWLADVINTYLEGAPRGLTLEAAFGLDGEGPGRLRWWTEETLEERNQALRELADHHFAGLELGRQADEILNAAARYAQGRWRFDQDRDELPPESSRAPREYLWRALRAGQGKIPLRRQLLRILRKQPHGGTRGRQ